MAKKFDFVVIGGGLVGCMACLSISGSNKSVCLIEKNKFNKIISSNYSPLSLSINSVNFLKEKNIWDESLLKSNVIKSLYIKLFNSFNTIKISSGDVNLESLGNIVDKALFLSHLRNLCKKNVNIEIIDNIEVDIDNTKSSSEIILPNGYGAVDYSHLIITDGANSKFAKKLNFAGTDINYEQTSFIFNGEYKSMEKSASQIFTNKGVFAVLPGDEDKKSIVATIHNKFINNFNFESNNVDEKMLQRELEPYVKDLKNLELIYKHPLNTVRLNQWYSKNVLLLGNSSQLLHPFGAQGFNFALDCIKKLDLEWEYFSSENEFGGQVTNIITNKRDELFKTIDLTSLLLMKNDILALISSSLIVKALNSSSTLKNSFIKKILNTQ
jgi:2-polyprenyl-6-methoxyphenol hydroxylase-like FAD-dependent oxidoreductase